MKTYYIYILTNNGKNVLYVGVTNDLEHRVFQHKGKFIKDSFTAKYNCDQLVYYEEYNMIVDAIAREELLKRYKRRWKEDLINEHNPDWLDLAADWFEPGEFDMYRKFDKK